MPLSPNFTRRGSPTTRWVISWAGPKQNPSTNTWYITFRNHERSLIGWSLQLVPLHFLRNNVCLFGPEWHSAFRLNFNIGNMLLVFGSLWNPQSMIDRTTPISQKISNSLNLTSLHLHYIHARYRLICELLDCIPSTGVKRGTILTTEPQAVGVQTTSKGSEKRSK